jgi:hypothetical protein
MARKAILIVVASGFEPRRDHENGVLEYPLLHELKNDEQPPDTAVAVREWVQGLELVVGRRGLDDRRH